MTANDLFTQAVAKIESKSIQTWAQNDHNKPIWLQICQNAVNNGRTNIELMAAYMVATAMGL